GLGATERGGALIVLEGEQPIGTVLQTFPEANSHLGFSGATNLLIGFSPEGTVIGTVIIASKDTRDHVELIRRNPSFLSAWNGLDRVAAGRARVDAVSGATLTSLAIVQGVRARLGNVSGSLKFPDDDTLSEARSIFPTAE